MKRTSLQILTVFLAVSGTYSLNATEEIVGIHDNNLNSTQLVLDIDVVEPEADDELEGNELDLFDDSYYDIEGDEVKGRELASRRRRSYYSKKTFYSKKTTTTTTYTPPKYKAVYRSKKTKKVYIPPPSKPKTTSRSGYYKPSKSRGRSASIKASTPPKPKKNLG